MIRNYIGVVHKEPKSDYGISFPDFLGCVSAGKTLDELHKGYGNDSMEKQTLGCSILPLCVLQMMVFVAQFWNSHQIQDKYERLTTKWPSVRERAKNWHKDFTGLKSGERLQ